MFRGLFYTILLSQEKLDSHVARLRQVVVIQRGKKRLCRLCIVRFSVKADGSDLASLSAALNIESRSVTASNCHPRFHEVICHACIEPQKSTEPVLK